jgi:hypothetical protein
LVRCATPCSAFLSVCPCICLAVSVCLSVCLSVPVSAGLTVCVSLSCVSLSASHCLRLSAWAAARAHFSALPPSSQLNTLPNTCSPEHSHRVTPTPRPPPPSRASAHLRISPPRACSSPLRLLEQDASSARSSTCSASACKSAGSCRSRASKLTGAQAVHSRVHRFARGAGAWAASAYALVHALCLSLRLAQPSPLVDLLALVAAASEAPYQLQAVRNYITSSRHRDRRHPQPVTGRPGPRPPRRSTIPISASFAHTKYNNSAN